MKYLLLALLARGPAHGYELKRLHDERFSVAGASINIGQIYVTLGRLERDGLVEHHPVESHEGPARKVYELTQVGHKELRAWLEAPGPVPQLRSAALLKIIVALEISPSEVPSLVAAHRLQCLGALRALDESARGEPGSESTSLLIQAGALHLQAELRWLDLLTERHPPAKHPPTDHQGEHHG